MSNLFFYTSCTLTKSITPPGHLSAAELPKRSVSERQTEWCTRIDSWEGERRTARDLYCGGHWSVVRGLVDLRLGLRCFAISAGYGLVSIDERLAPYAATFAFGQRDSVALAHGKNAPKENIEWWYRLCSWKPVGVKGVRSICASVTSAPTAIHVFALSPSYLDAISEDLARARQELVNRSRLIILSSGKARHGELNANVIPVPAELQTRLGGGLVSLNVRVAAEVLSRIPVSDMTFEEVRKFISELASRAKPRFYPKRYPASDDEVISFIEKAARNAWRPSYTGLLRSFRGSGRACEMKRFKKLFQQTVTK